MLDREDTEIDTFDSGGLREVAPGAKLRGKWGTTGILAMALELSGDKSAADIRDGGELDRAVKPQIWAEPQSEPRRDGWIRTAIGARQTGGACGGGPDRRSAARQAGSVSFYLLRERCGPDYYSIVLSWWCVCRWRAWSGSAERRVRVQGKVKRVILKMLNDGEAWSTSAGAAVPSGVRLSSRAHRATHALSARTRPQSAG